MMMKIKIIAAASYNSVIGDSGKLPWAHDYKEDMAFFRKMTTGSTIIMGRKTFDTIKGPLPNRRNIVLTRQENPKQYGGIEYFSNLEKALESCKDDVWIIGGSYIYQEALKYASEIYITTIPKIITGNDLVYFPYVNPNYFRIIDRIELSKEKDLFCTVYGLLSSPSYWHYTESSSCLI